MPGIFSSHWTYIRWAEIFAYASLEFNSIRIKDEYSKWAAAS